MALLERIAAASALGRTDRAAAAAQLSRLWEELGADDWLARCAAAHALADVQEEPVAELAWDLAALAAAHLQPDPAMFPSLHLNVAEAFRKVGAPESSREHLALGRSAIDALGGDPYGGMLVDALDRLEQRLAQLA